MKIILTILSMILQTEQCFASNMNGEGGDKTRPRVNKKENSCVKL